MTQSTILSTAYFAPVQWFQKLNRSVHCYIECHDHYVKQTYRNRCIIATTNGPQALTIPIERPEGRRADKTPMRDIRISDHGAWRHLHWNALQSAYGESPFFEFYADDLRPFFEKRWEFLIDFNTEITYKMCELLDIQPHIELTTQYEPIPQEEALARQDYRDIIRPKHPGDDPTFTPERYYQVYQQKWGFLPNLSILDLLFNEGNESVFYL